MQVFFLNRFFHPDYSATSQLLSDLAFALANAGGEVQVITSRQLYNDPNAKLRAFETVNGVIVHRVWTSRFGRAWLPGRALDYLSFYLAAWWRLWRLVRRGDVIVAKTDPPLISLVGGLVAWLRGARLVNWLQDIFPEVADALGVKLARGRLGQVLRALRNVSLRAASMNVVLGERMASGVRDLGIAADRVVVIHNWADGEAIRPSGQEDNALRSAWGFENKFVVAYSGNMGRAHEFETILGAAELIEKGTRPNEKGESLKQQGERIEEQGAWSKEEGKKEASFRAPASCVSTVPAETTKRQPKVVFVFIGGGYWRPWLEREVERRAMRNVVFKPYQSRELLSQSLGAGDVHLISLLPAVEGLIVPSKFYGIAGAGRPVLYIGDLDGEVPRLLRESACGEAFAVGDAEGLALAILRLRDDPALGRAWGANARREFEVRFNAPLAIGSWKKLLEDLRSEGGGQRKG